MTNALACLAQSGGLKRASGCLILGRELQRAACALASAARLLRRAHLHAHPHTRACAPAPALTNTCIHTHSHNTCAHKCAHCTQEGMHAQIHTHAHARTHAHIQHACKRVTFARTGTHLLPCTPWLLPPGCPAPWSKSRLPSPCPKAAIPAAKEATPHTGVCLAGWPHTC